MSSINHRIDRGYGRRSGLRPIKQSFLIITEGANTEPDYFTSFRLTSANINVSKLVGYTYPKLHKGKEWYVDFYALDPVGE